MTTDDVSIKYLNLELQMKKLSIELENREHLRNRRARMIGHALRHGVVDCLRKYFRGDGKKKKRRITRLDQVNKGNGMWGF